MEFLLAFFFFFDFQIFSDFLFEISDAFEVAESFYEFVCKRWELLGLCLSGLVSIRGTGCAFGRTQPAQSGDDFFDFCFRNFRSFMVFEDFGRNFAIVGKFEFFSY
jgi:hypothetical protein